MPPRISAAMVARGRTVAEPRLSPDGTSVAFLSTLSGRASLVVVPVDGGPERTITTDPAPTPSRSYGGGAFDWTPDGAAVVYAAVGGGLWFQPVAGGPPRKVADGAWCAAPAVSPDGTRVAYVVDELDVAVASLEEGGPWPVRLSGGNDFALDPAWSPDGATVAWHEWDVPNMAWDSSRIVTAPADGSKPPTTVAGGEGVGVQQPRWSSTGRLGYLCEAHGWLNLWADGSPFLEEPCEHGTGAWGPGQRSWAWSPDGEKAVLNRNEGGFGRLVTTDGAQLGKAVHGGLSWVGDRIAAVRSGARTPTSVVMYDGGGERRVLAVGPVEGFEPALVEPELVTWPGEDGVEIPGRLYRPAGEANGGLICWVHGGPTDQWGVTFQPRFPYFLERGWTVLVPDHRGSTGHGRAFTQAMAGRWGELDVADVAAGLRAAGERGWADPRRLAIMGGSAGGFTVLNVLAAHPDLCAAGVDLFGVADLFDLDETTHRFEAHYLHTIVGPLPAAADAYRERSPVNRAESITAPLLILQGTDDKVVPPAQSQAIADRLAGLGRTVELHLYEGEGHGWGRAETVMDELERTESFLRRHVLRWRA